MTKFSLIILAFLILASSVFAQDDVSIDIGTIPQGQQVTISYDATVGNLPAGTVVISNQGTVSGSNFDPILSNDPQTSANGDSTLTQVGFNLPVSELPSTGETPMLYLVLFSLLIATIGAGAAYFVAQRRAN